MSNIGNLEFDNLKIKSNRSIYCESFYFIDVFDEVNLKKFIKSVERTVRSSREYKKYIENLRTNVHALNYDTVMSNISNTDTALEFHHYPLSLYEISEILILDHLANKDNITSFSIAKEIMECHFKNKIGLVSLTKTNHELAHDGAIFLHKNQIFGKYEEFINEHPGGISMDIRNKINRLNEMSDANVATDFKGLL